MKKTKKALLIGAIALGALVLIFLIPIIINELYKTQNGYTTVWSGADVLAYYGSLLGFAGTVVLGIVAYRQNNKMHKLNERVTNLQKRNPLGYLLLDASKTLFDPHRQEAVKHEYYFNLQYPILFFKNISQSPLMIKGVECYCNGELHKKEQCDSFFSNIEHEFNEMAVDLALESEGNMSKAVEFRIVFYLENINGYSYREVVTLLFEPSQTVDYIFKLSYSNYALEEDRWIN